MRSIRSSIIEYRREYGRTYHSYKDGSPCYPPSPPQLRAPLPKDAWLTHGIYHPEYVFPNDHIENDRLGL